MKVIKAHKIELKPNNKQKTYFAKACGVARFTYNFCLAYSKSEYEAGRPIMGFALKKYFNSIKREQFPFVMEVTKTAPEQAIADLTTAFKNMWKHKTGYPKFKKKGVKDSFYISNDKFRLEDKKVRIPKLGWVRMTEPLRFDGKIISATVSRHADRWFISIGVEVEMQEPSINRNAVGIDLGVTRFGALSTGDFIDNPKPHKALLLRLRLLNKELSRRTKGGKNWNKTKLKIQKLHRRIANIRKDFLHKVTTELSSKYGYVMIEDLNVKGMARTKLARSILDQSFSEFRRLLEYKVQNVIAIDRFFPSSKTCSQCGTYYPDFGRGESKMRCCDQLNRDYNASLNILNEGLSMVGSTTQDYCLDNTGVAYVA